MPCRTACGELRQELFGDQGGPEMARLLGLPARTWYNYETGVTVPGHVLVLVAKRTEVNASWLLTGQGPILRSKTDQP